MAVDVSNSSYSLPPPGTPSQDGLGYSRHYAKRIRDMGASSKDSWIKRIWTHMFSRGKKGDQKEDDTQSKGSQEKIGKTVTFGTVNKDDIGSIPGNSPKLSEGTPSEASNQTVNLPPIKSNSVRTTSRESQSQSRSAPPHQRSLGEKRVLPAELANSPYLAPRERANYKIVGIDKHNAARIAVHERLRDGGHGNPGSNQVNNQKGNVSSGGHGANQPQKRIAFFQSKSAPGLYGRKPTHPYLSTHPDTWKPPRIAFDPKQARVEKQAKMLADSAVQSHKIFTCQGPFPVDAYVRFSLRKRGWVEKFGPQANSDQRRGVSSKLSCEDDEDFEAICSQDVPAPWEEEYGVYAIVSRIVRHYPARFIWGGRNVNNLVLRTEVIVNHFPKARFFSSKVLLTQSLRELPWLISADAHDFFPRCYLLNEDDKEDFIEDFRITACIGVLRWVMEMVTVEDSQQEMPASSREKTKYEEVTHVERDRTLKKSTSAFDLEPRIVLNDGTNCKPDTENTPEDKDLQTDGCEPPSQTDRSEPPSQTDRSEPPSQTDRSEPPSQTDQSEPPSSRMNDDADDEFSDIEACVPDIELAADIDKACMDPDHPDGGKVQVHQTQGREEEIYDPLLPTTMSYNTQVARMKPEICKKEKKGGQVPMKAVDWALSQLERFLRMKEHSDLDSARLKAGLTSDQWEQFLQWFLDISSEGATVPITEAKYREAKDMLKRIKSVWSQYNIDGLRNVWLVKPGDSSKGKGIEFCNKLEDIVKYIDNATTQGNYVIMKCIEQPLLIYNCKFDIRQWFLVTDWNPLTVWFYKSSYLRICSHEFSWDTMHEAVHLSNVAVQQNYQNGERSDKLPDNNFLPSDLFQDYLAEIGHPDAWSDIIYPGMKEAIVHTLLATMDISENKRSAFELYGADFMLSEDFRPWLLEINASPGMAPTSLEKAKLCAMVIEDTIKVVIDRKENKFADIGNYELAFRETQLPPFKCVDTKMLCEGSRIRRPDLQRYAYLDQKAAKAEAAAQRREQKKLKKEPKENESGSDDKMQLGEESVVNADEDKSTADSNDKGTDLENKKATMHTRDVNKTGKGSPSDSRKRGSNNLRGVNVLNNNSSKNRGGASGNNENARVALIKKTYGVGDNTSSHRKKSNSSHR